MAASKDYEIKMGKTFQRVLRWEGPPFRYSPIVGITKTAPAVIDAPSHGVLDGQKVAIVSVKGMTEINAQNTPPKEKDYVRATVIDADTIELNTVNASGFKTYTSGGYVQSRTPIDMTGFTARMSIKDKVGGTVLLSLTTENGGITIDPAAGTVTLTISAVDTAAIVWKKGVYDLEMVSSGGVVTELFSGKVAVINEVTT